MSFQKTFQELKRQKNQKSHSNIYRVAQKNIRIFAWQ